MSDHPSGRDCAAEARLRDLIVIRERLIRALAPATPAAAENLARTARSLAKSLLADGKWPDIDYGDQLRSEWKTARHLLNLLQMAVAYRIGDDAPLPGLDFNQHIKTALDWWLRHDPHNPNWWHNEIGVPKLLGTIALFTGDGLNAGELARIIEILKRSEWGKWTGQNLIWGTQIEIMRGILARDAETAAQGYARMYEEVRLGPPTGEGIMPDFSFHQHGAQLYSGGYGLNFADDVGAFVSFAWGTTFQVPSKTMEIYTRYVLDGVAWMTRGNVFDYSATGREITRKGKLAAPPPEQATNLTTIAAAYRLTNVAESLAALDVPRRDEYAAFAARLRGSRDAAQLSGNRHCWCSDYMLHQRPQFFASVRMFSSRLINTELVNDEGKQSHHLADGCTLLYRTGEEYRDIFPVWDWSKVPGTTAEQMDLLKQTGGPRYKTPANFVGGVSDGTYGLAAQELDRDTLRARKTWMMFDDGLVALGAGINCESDRSVITSINQCLSRGDRVAPAGAGFAWHDDIVYVLPASQRFELTHGPQTGRWSDIGAGSDQPVTEQVFKIWIDHGVRPTNASYMYFVLAGVSSSDAADRARTSGIEVLSNTATVQAVRIPKLKLLGAAFWNAARLKENGRPSVSVDHPCLLMLHERDGRVGLSVSNPTNQPLQVNVTIDRKVSGEDATLTVAGTTIAIELPGGALAGSTVQKDFRLL